MPLYAFHLRGAEGFCGCFETKELLHDSAAYQAVGDVLDEHASADYVDVWSDDRPVFSRHRDGPQIRPIEEHDDPRRVAGSEFEGRAASGPG